MIHLQNTIFMSVIFVLGLLLTVISLKIESVQSKACTVSKLKNANRGILVIGIACMTAFMSFMTCKYNCDCDDASELGNTVYVSFALAMGVVLIGLGSVISEAASGDCAGVKPYSRPVWIIGLIITLLSLGVFGLRGYDYYRAAGNSFGF